MRRPSFCGQLLPAGAGPVFLGKLCGIVRRGQAPLQANVAWNGGRRHEMQALFAPIGRYGAPRLRDLPASCAFCFDASIVITGVRGIIMSDALAAGRDIEIWNRASVCASSDRPSFRGRSRPCEREHEKHGENKECRHRDLQLFALPPGATPALMRCGHLCFKPGTGKSSSALRKLELQRNFGVRSLTAMLLPLPPGCPQNIAGRLIFVLPPPRAHVLRLVYARTFTMCVIHSEFHLACRRTVAVFTRP